MQRYLKNQLEGDLQEKMVFLGGPRQVGKTTLAKSLMPDDGAYLNWDIPRHRELILRKEIPAADFLVFDELHKNRSWRNFLKGLYDDRPHRHILVTGSARLDYYRFGGDSLQGRYHYLRLHPLSVAELGSATSQDLQTLLNLGGFPEPFLSGSAVRARRWSREYRTRLVREDLLSVERVDDLGKLELLMLRLPELVGAPLSLNALREDLEVSHVTLARWVDVLERLYAIFRLPPFGAPKIRAVKKERKHYHADWSLVADPALRFENLVACHLMKWVHFLQDSEGRDVELRYFRDTDGREVDFVVTEGRSPMLFVEAKWTDADPSPALRYLKIRFPNVPAWQISAVGQKDVETRDGIRLTPAHLWLKTLI